MSERLCSVGLDVGTTSTQMILSELIIENRASGFSVPEMEISQRKILYKSPVHFTPLLEDRLVDGRAIRELITREYQNAGISRSRVDTGAIIITGETSRKENARAVLEALSDFAGDFVVATAGPDLESILAAKGSGAVEYARQTGKRVLHMDIGGGTSNLALIEDGTITRTGCLNVGGRLVKFDDNGAVTYLSPVLQEHTSLSLGKRPCLEEMEASAALLVQALEMAAGLRRPDPLLRAFWTEETGGIWEIPSGDLVFSFSGGVADCIQKDHAPLAFGDLGPALGRAIRSSRLCGGEYILGTETIRATVIGAGCHSAQLSGSTVFHQNIAFPLKNIPVMRIEDISQLGRALAAQEGTAVIAMEGIAAPAYVQVARMAEEIRSQSRGAILLCLEQDMAKALGQALALRLPRETSILCIDRVKVSDGSYLDIASPVAGALPVVVKTLVLGR